MNDKDNNGTQEESREFYEDEVSQFIQSPQSSSIDESLPRTNSRPQSAASTSRSITTPTVRRKKAKVSASVSGISADDILIDVHKKLKNEDAEDEFAVVGKNVAYKLRKLSKETAMVAEKLIMDLLFEAQLGNIEKSSEITITQKGQAVQQQTASFTTLQQVHSPVQQGQNMVNPYTTGTYFGHYNPNDRFN
ncbi:uncharacterized protein LOC126750740 [Anthonomus grandis grandis]|uniref:uncharacterized protein LOC126750740 n=1 Tax=Anthonomus grandis grandis TaxID=2921223 RepID=UPI002166003D|nr:uncharacterized protein LOC126750740 [Anthonomus grandis grandis]